MQVDVPQRITRRGSVPAGNHVRLGMLDDGLEVRPDTGREIMAVPTVAACVAFNFDRAFAKLCGHSPFPWQRRLFRLLCEGSVPRAVDIPTGLGKTAVMACWLLARASGVPLPRRLIYVVDRRVVVDQATEIAENIRDRLDDLPEVREKLSLGRRRLPISTLRGQHLDNREWLEDPVATAIIVGTVDMIGSRILFSGYGVSRKMRPNVAGLLGCDSLVVLDEAHLSRPFERLLLAIEGDRRISGSRETGILVEDGPEAVAGLGVPPPFRVLPLSATLGSVGNAAPFRLDDEDRSDCTVVRRLNAQKTLRITDLGKGTSLDDALSETTWNLYLEETAAVHNPVRLLVYCHRREVAEKVARKLKLKLKGEGSDAKTILFTGGRRVRERQQAAAELQECGLIADKSNVPTHSVFVVATSAGEVGVDLDADHMVCDLVEWERMVQRLGRVNRRGTRKARVHVIDGGEQADDSEADRLRSVRQLLSMLPEANGDGHQAGPGALADLAQLPGSDGLIEKASTTTPSYPALTRRLVEAWSLTSLAEHTGRPEVGPWLRGWVDDYPQTSVAWRRFLPLRFHARVSEATLQTGKVEKFFDAAPLQASELLETETWRVTEWLTKRVRTVLRSLGDQQADPESDARIADSEMGASGNSVGLFRMHENSVVALLLDDTGKLRESFSLKHLLKRLTETPAKSMNHFMAGRRLVVDARLGGIQDDGLLDAACDTPATTLDGSEGEDMDDGWGNRTVRVQLVGGNSRGNDSIKEEDWLEVLASPYLVSSEGEEVIWLVVEQRAADVPGGDSPAVSSRPQELGEHQGMVAAEVARIADGLKLDSSDRAMLVAAAASHDAGKGAPRWQRAFNARREGGPYAKTSGPLNLSILNGYRHEFQSVLLAGRDGLNGVDRSSLRYDLALHLIASHHGYARPVIGTDGCEMLPPTLAARRAHEIAVRFTRMQNTLGPWGLAWWESLLRAADRRASMRHQELAQKRRVAGQGSERHSNGNGVASGEGERDVK